MRAALIIFGLIFAACSGGQKAAEGAGGGLGDYSGGDGGCELDAQCPSGMVCEGCEADGAKTCLPGCRVDSQCGVDEVCSHDVECVQCPCPPGWCELDPCRDVDHDGYVPAADALSCAPGTKAGDCDDLNPAVNPGRLEVCDDGIDDDCDGHADGADSQCQVCTVGRSCTDVYSCWVGQEQCDAGCCEACTPVVEPGCGPNECLFPDRHGLDGCPEPGVCGPCASSCSSDDNPVCGVDYGWYQNECLALAAGTQVLHGGNCWSGEGVECAGPAGSVTACGPSTSYYCRQGQPMRCTGRGFCLDVSDCPAGEPTACTDGGTATWSCVLHQCSSSCGGT